MIRTQWSRCPCGRETASSFIRCCRTIRRPIGRGHGGEPLRSPICRPGRATRATARGLPISMCKVKPTSVASGEDRVRSRSADSRSPSPVAVHKGLMLLRAGLGLCLCAGDEWARARTVAPRSRQRQILPRIGARARYAQALMSPCAGNRPHLAPANRFPDALKAARRSAAGHRRCRARAEGPAPGRGPNRVIASRGRGARIGYAAGRPETWRASRIGVGPGRKLHGKTG